MATNAYLDRLGQLQDEKYSDLQSKISLPIQRPLNKQQPGMVPQQKPQEDSPDFDTPFGQNFHRFSQEDSRFGNMFQEFSKMAHGMREMVAQGMMPPQIAQQRLQQYLTDSRTHFASTKKKPTDDPQTVQALEGALGNLAQEQQAEAPQPADLPQQQDQSQVQGGM